MVDDIMPSLLRALPCGGLGPHRGLMLGGITAGGPVGLDFSTLTLPWPSVTDFDELNETFLCWIPG